MPSSSFPRAPQRIAQRDWFERAVGLGYAARGLLYTVIAITALSVALGDGGDTTGSTGALQKLSQQSYGTILVAVLALGLGAYAIWRLLQAVAGGNDDDSFLKTTWMRGYYGVRAILYGVLCWSAVRLLMGSGGGGGNSRQTLTKRALELPGGRWIVGAVGLAIVGYGLWQGYRSLAKRFEDELEMHRMSREVERVVVPAAMVGYLARMVVFGMIGYFFIEAAVNYAPDKAVGLDGALSSLKQTAYGPGLLAAIAIGLLGFAVFSFAESKYREIEVDHG
ncbi:MAG: DUF1206 domain-containing protein [Nitriliruptorales bacterium]|nr:DUF1206 domain-containing protein [Nitriliruptorales bacterium]